MEPEQITSTKNPLVGRFRMAASGEDPDAVLADGFLLVQEALAAGLEPLEAAWSDVLMGRAAGPALLNRLRSAVRTEVRHCTDHVLAKISHLKTHQGIVACFARPPFEPARLLRSGSLVAVAAGIQDPGNLGAILRSAEAAGASGFIVLRGGADPFRDKSVRGSSGSVFRLPCWPHAQLDSVVNFARENKLQVVVAETAGGQAPWEVDFTRPTLLVLGAEGGGVDSALRSLAEARVTVPIESSVESLNVAVAAGVLLFEARRQRSVNA